MDNIVEWQTQRTQKLEEKVRVLAEVNDPRTRNSSSTFAGSWSRSELH